MTSRVKIIGGVVGALVAVAAGAGVYIKSQRAEYVRLTLSHLPDAEKEYAGGRFTNATSVAALAVVRHGTHPTWFDPADVKKIRDTEEFFAGQLALWNRVETAASGLAADPAKTRADLEGLLEEARRAAPRSQPLIDRVEPHLKASLAGERDKAEAALALRIPEARQAYEKASWDALLGKLNEIRALIAALPDATRVATAKKFEADVQAIENSAKPVSAMRAILAGTDDGVIKADRLRDLISGLVDLKGRDVPLHRDLRRSIAEVDPETRKPVAGLKLKKEALDQLAETFKKGGDLERIGNPDETSVLEMQDSLHRYSLRVLARPPRLLIEVDRVRLMAPLAMAEDREVLLLGLAAKLSKELRAARPARLFSEEAWLIRADAPATCAIHFQGNQASVLIGGRLFDGTATELDGAAPVATFRAAGAALEQAVRDSAAVPEEIKGPLAEFLKAAHTRAPPGDHLDGKFCREAVQEGYVEAHLPKMDEGVAACLKEYRKTYGDVARLRSRFETKAADGASASLLANFENDALWRVTDPAANTTTFSTIPRDHMGSSLTAVSVFAGVHAEFPADTEPIEVRMANGVTGTVSRWTSAAGKLEFEPKAWANAVTLGEGIPEHFGTGDWQIPPHALKVDGRGQARELILPAGSVKVAGFPDGPGRRDAEEKFLQRCSEVFRSPGEYHLFYRYFVQYVLDSPVTTATTLIGSGKHCGDAHQDAYQTLDRRLNGRFLADCDDLAELYWTVLRRQDRAAFVLGVPGHATCGVAEKNGSGWTFFCVDTGPARQLKGPDLDDIIEKVLRSYDRDRSMSFDPRQMRFLFRFAGEQTRSDYYLDSRILRDPPYADLMIRVQEYWHFGFYALGIETMSKVLETDRMPANCQEIAGLYTRVGLWPEALQWTEAGIKGLDAKDVFTGLSDTMRVIQCYREMKRQDDAVRTLRASAQAIAAVVKADPGVEDRYRRLKFQVALEFAQVDLPWDGWAFVEDDVVKLFQTGVVAESLMSMVTEIFARMRDAQRSGAKLAEAQVQKMNKVGEMLEEYNKSGLFERDDSNMDLMRKNAQLYGYYAAVEGAGKAAAELAKAEYPAERSRPASRDGVTPAADWPWIRLSPFAYAVAAANALDKDDKAAGGPREAISVIRALEAALPEIRRRGSLGTAEFAVLDLRLLRACLEMDEKSVRSVFDEMKRQGWGELYENLSRTLGAAAAYMKLEDFEKVFRLYCEYEVPRRHYYGVVYSALAAEAQAHALAASKFCIERFPKDADMAREHALLQKLAK